jgi:hypothetical protein
VNEPTVRDTRNGVHCVEAIENKTAGEDYISPGCSPFAHEKNTVLPHGTYAELLLEEFHPSSGCR